MHIISNTALKTTLTYKCAGNVTDEDDYTINSLMNSLDNSNTHIHFEHNTADMVGYTNQIINNIINETLTTLNSLFKHVFIISAPSASHVASNKAFITEMTERLLDYSFKFDAMLQSLYIGPGRNNATVLTDGNNIVIIRPDADKHLLYTTYVSIIVALMDVQDPRLNYDSIDRVRDAFNSQGILHIRTFRDLFGSFITPEVIAQLQQEKRDQIFKQLDTYMGSAVINDIKNALSSNEESYNRHIGLASSLRISSLTLEQRLYAIQHGLDETVNFGSRLKEAHEDGIVTGYYFSEESRRIKLTVDTYLTPSSSLNNVIRAVEKNAFDPELLPPGILNMLEQGTLKIPVSDTISLKLYIGSSISIQVEGGSAILYNMSGETIPRNKEWNMGNTHINHFDCFAHGKGQIKKYFSEGKVDQMFIAAAEAVGNFNFYDASVAPTIHREIIDYLKGDGLIKVRTATGWDTQGGKELYETHYAQQQAARI